MSVQRLPPDILHTIYQYLDPLDVHTISSSALVSRAFNCIFHAYLYKHLVVSYTSSRIPALIKTLEESPALRSTMQSLTFRFDYTSPKVTKFLRRVFKSPPNHFHRFVQFIIKTCPSNLRLLVLFGSKSFCKLETLHINQPRAAYEDMTEGLYALVIESCRETLRRVHLRAIPEFIGRGEDEFLEDAPFCVDFERHTVLETIIVSSYLPSFPPSMTHDKAVELLKPYYTHVLASEIGAISTCLRSIVKLPPSLALLRVHIHLVISDTQLDEALQIQSGRVEGSVLQWDLRMLDGHLVNMVQSRSNGDSLCRVMLGVQFVPPLTSGLGEYRRVRLEDMFVGMRGAIGDGFSLYTDDECRIYRP